ncbi:carboxylating nicotinate-nucleotide diphosphorylase [Halobacillus fulvus]|nr:carboxylating nicotinate-nucleotide diphosphorylase [Halobacillus fulvus]
MNPFAYKQTLEQFFMEDIGYGDWTSDLLFPEEATGTLTFISKQQGIFCGKDLLKTGYALLDSEIQADLPIQDGTFVSPGVEIASFTGPVRSLLKGERVLLNLIQRMSGIATLTHQAVQTIADSHTKICDTRKTTPGLRAFEKSAVRAGGGFNHRFGLDDAVMIKDNHIAFAGSITEAVQTIRSSLGHTVKIEVETENADQVMEAVAAGVDIIMFDNRTPEEIFELQRLVPSSILTEASGGITMESLSSYRGLGVDYISLGFLTHSASALDISARVLTEKEEVK